MKDLKDNIAEPACNESDLIAYIWSKIGVKFVESQTELGDRDIMWDFADDNVVLYRSISKSICVTNVWRYFQLTCVELNDAANVEMTKYFKDLDLMPECWQKLWQEKIRHLDDIFDDVKTYAEIDLLLTLNGLNIED